jgi:hypothetical protein
VHSFSAAPFRHHNKADPATAAVVGTGRGTAELGLASDH